MKRKKLLACTLAALMFVGTVNPTNIVMAAEAEQPVVQETDGCKNNSVTTATEEFVIVDGVLIEYTGNGGCVTIPNGVTSIGAHAFSACCDLTNIEIPESVTSIGAYAFNGCCDLTSIEIPGSVTSIEALVFCDCTELTDVTIKDGVTSIGTNAFLGDEKLVSVRIPDSVTSIGCNPFYGCGESLVIFCNVGSAAEKYAKDADIRYSSDEKVAQTIFVGATNNNNKMIAALNDEVQLAASVDGDGRLSYTSSNNAVVTVDQKGNMKFVGEGEAKITIKASKTISRKAAKRVIKVTVIDSSKPQKGATLRVGKTTYMVTTAGKEVTYVETGLKASTIKIPATITVDGIKYKVTSIDADALEGNTNLRKVVIGNNVKTIGNGAFSGCANLESVTVGKNVTKIGKDAFKGCKELCVVKINSAKLKTVGKNAFKGMKDTAIIKVPKKKLKSYKKLLKGKGMSSKVTIAK